MHVPAACERPRRRRPAGMVSTRRSAQRRASYEMFSLSRTSRNAVKLRPRRLLQRMDRQKQASTEASRARRCAASLAMWHTQRTTLHCTCTEAAISARTLVSSSSDSCLACARSRANGAIPTSRCTFAALNCTPTLREGDSRSQATRIWARG